VAEELRKQHSATSSITVFLYTNRFSSQGKQYYNSRSVQLPHPVGSSSELLRYASAALDAVFKDQYEYQKVGVFMTGLVQADQNLLLTL
jgi:DNA polymerase V